MFVFVSELGLDLNQQGPSLALSRILEAGLLTSTSKTIQSLRKLFRSSKNLPLSKKRSKKEPARRPLFLVKVESLVCTVEVIGPSHFAGAGRKKSGITRFARPSALIPFFSGTPLRVARLGY